MKKLTKLEKLSLGLVCVVMTITASEAAIAVPASYLYVQTATSGSIVKNNDGTSAYTITLNGVSPDTVEFTDRPLRVANKIGTMDFIQHWGRGSDNFKIDPPNAILSYTENHQLRTLDVVTISAPHYDSQSHILNYQAMPVSKNAQLPNAATITRPSLFIDMKW